MPLRLEWLDPRIEKAFKVHCEKKFGATRRGNYSMGFEEMVKFFLDEDTQEFFKKWKKTKARVVFGLNAI